MSTTQQVTNNGLSSHFFGGKKGNRSKTENRNCFFPSRMFHLRQRRGPQCCLWGCGGSALPWGIFPSWSLHGRRSGRRRQLLRKERKYSVKSLVSQRRVFSQEGPSL